MNLLLHFAYYVDYSYSRSIHEVAPVVIAPAVIMTILFTILVIFLGIYAIHAFLLSRIFKKAGIKSWAAWVPFYNIWKLLEIGDQPSFWAVLSIITPLNIVTSVFTYIAMYRIGLKLGKDGSWVILAIFLPTIWMAILAFDSSKWNPKGIKP